MAFFEGYYQTQKFQSMKTLGDKIRQTTPFSEEYYEAEKQAQQLGLNVFYVSFENGLNIPLVFAFVFPALSDNVFIHK